MQRPDPSIATVVVDHASTDRKPDCILKFPEGGEVHGYGCELTYENGAVKIKRYLTPITDAIFTYACPGLTDENIAHQNPIPNQTLANMYRRRGCDDCGETCDKEECCKDTDDTDDTEDKSTCWWCKWWVMLGPYCGNPDGEGAFSPKCFDPIEED